jgi:hypothetical protein
MVRTFIIVATVLSIVVTAQTPCYLCSGDPDATFLLPDVILPVPPELQVEGITEIGCEQLFQTAVSGLLNSTQCDLASNSIELQTACGCSNLEGVAPVVSPVGVAPVISPVVAPAIGPTPVLSPVLSFSPSSSMVPSTMPSDGATSLVPSTTPTAALTSPPILLETIAPTSSPSDSPSDAPSLSPSACPKGKGKKKGGMMKGGMMKGGMMKGGMMKGGKGDKGKGKMSKDSERGRRNTRAMGEPDDDDYDDDGEEEEDDDEEYDECPEYSKKSKAPKAGMMGKGKGSGDEESTGKGMMDLKDHTPVGEKKKEPKRLRY